MIKLKHFGNVLSNDFSKYFMFLEYLKYISPVFRLVRLTCRISDSQQISFFGGGKGVSNYQNFIYVHIILDFMKNLNRKHSDGLLSAIIESLENFRFLKLQSNILSYHRQYAICIHK